MSRIETLENQSIATLSRKAIASLSALPTQQSTNVNKRSIHGFPFTVDNELERFDIWRAEHGVEHGKLDHTLRETSLLRMRVVSLLEEICGKINIVNIYPRNIPD